MIPTLYIYEIILNSNTLHLILMGIAGFVGGFIVGAIWALGGRRK